MTLIKFKNHFPSFVDEFFGGDIFDSVRNSSVIGNSLPAVNVKNHQDHFEVEVAAPGMNKDDFKIEVQNRVLGISSELKEDNNEDNKNYTRREFNYRSFKRNFTLPKSVNEEKISANYKDGVLRIEIPKQTEERKESSRFIEIN